MKKIKMPSPPTKTQRGNVTRKLPTDSNMIFLTVPAQKNATPKNSTATPRATSLPTQT
ncbi:hypothetical protein [Priestia koreensis]|uniref:hypothetical protein n=1 Tax=Priestia koreensis TaxID=284581 RepID=UPI0028F6CB67|nr:hypothetical protein [Priestia koreensis]